MSNAITSSIKDFVFDMFLMYVITDEKEHDGEGTEAPHCYPPSVYMQSTD